MRWASSTRPSLTARRAAACASARSRSRRAAASPQQAQQIAALTKQVAEKTKEIEQQAQQISTLTKQAADGKKEFDRVSAEKKKALASFPLTAKWRIRRLIRKRSTCR